MTAATAAAVTTYQADRHPRRMPIVAFRLKVLARPYERPALRNSFAAFPATSKVA